MAIKTTKQFKEKIDTAFETMKTRDEAKACCALCRVLFEPRRRGGR